ncbi:MAG TPA: Fe-Mn family superoxide dismutase [Methylomirabilota bacterium]|nr:Fe-Mn family superoxide dismutase [Methylomirabilota bacterium]
MSYEVAALPFKLHRLDGLSERLMVSHYENNYGGAVRRLNAIDARIAALDWATAPGFEVNGLGRERLVAVNSMVLHEIYFEGLGGIGEPAGALAAALERDFGSVGAWRAEFVGMGKALAGGSGWVLLTWSDRLGRLVNQWAADHAHVLADGAPILALDMYEHAYALDFGAKAAAYVDAFMRNIHWDRVEARRRRAIDVAPAPADSERATVTELRDLLQRGREIALLDVCLQEDIPRRTDKIPGARFLPAEQIDRWASESPSGRPVIVYCIYGFQVSGEAAAELRRRGFDARTLAGGITAWHAMGLPTEPLTPTQKQGEAA